MRLLNELKRVLHIPNKPTHPGFWTITIQFDLSMLAVKTVPEIRKMVHEEMKYVTEQALYCLEEIKAEGREHERASTPNEAS